MSMIRFNGRRRLLGRPVLIFSFLLLLFISSLAHSSPLSVGEKAFRRVYPVSGDAHLTVKNYMGTIQVRIGEKDRIVVVADVPESQLRLERPDKSNMIKIAAAKEPGIRPINFIVTVPPNCALTLHSFNGKVLVQGSSGDIEVETHEGDIDLLDLRSDFVKASSINGRITFNGELVPGGQYHLDSINSIDVWLASDASFDLTAISERNHIDLDGFTLLNAELGRRVTGRHGQGGAKLRLTSQGGIHLHRR